MPPEQNRNEGAAAQCSEHLKEIPSLQAALNITRDVIKALRKEAELYEENDMIRLSADIETHQLKEL